MSDKDIIQRIIERPEYQKYLFPVQPETGRIRSYIEDLLEYLYGVLSEMFENVDPLQVFNFLGSMLKALEDSSLLKILIVILVVTSGFWFYRYISKMEFSSKKTLLSKAPHPGYKEISHIPEIWQELIKNILNHYLSSLRISLQPHMTLRQCLRLLADNHRNDNFIEELVDFLEKWHFSDWQPGQETIQNWFIKIKKKWNTIQPPRAGDIDN